MTAPFTAAKHPRAAGGLFAATAASKSTHPTGAWAAGPMSYHAGRGGGTGTGYGVPGGDPRVRALQAALNKLGLKDSTGHPLLVDGKLGPRTTSAVKAAQKKLGVKADGVVTAALMVQILTMKAPAAGTSRAARPKARHVMSGRRHH